MEGPCMFKILLCLMFGIASKPQLTNHKPQNYEHNFGLSALIAIVIDNEKEGYNNSNNEEERSNLRQWWPYRLSLLDLVLC